MAKMVRRGLSQVTPLWQRPVALAGTKTSIIPEEVMGKMDRTEVMGWRAQVGLRPMRGTTVLMVWLVVAAAAVAAGPAGIVSVTVMAAAVAAAVRVVSGERRVEGARREALPTVLSSKIAPSI